MLCFDQKRQIRGQKTLLKLIFQNLLGNQTFKRIAICIMVDSYDMDLMKGIVILVKVDEIYNILKSASHYLLVYR